MSSDAVMCGSHTTRRLGRRGATTTPLPRTAALLLATALLGAACGDPAATPAGEDVREVNPDADSGAGTGADTGDDSGTDTGTDTDAHTDDTTLPCADGALQCGGACINPLNDPDHCGACDRPCLTDGVCVDATCACPQGTEACGDACVNTQTNPDHCGQCDQACPDQTPACSQGECRTGCAPTEQRCGDACVDTLVDLQHCGDCDAPCVGLTGEVALCLNGFCETTCAVGFVDVDGEPGCEYACRRTNAGLEVCDGVDNNCDGTIDAADPVLRSDLCAEQRGVCAGAVAVCVDATASCGDASYAAAAAPAAWQPAAETRCDGVDNNCDGATDPGCCADAATPARIPSFVVPTGYTSWVERRPTAYVDDGRVRVLYERLVRPVDGDLRRDVALATPGDAGGPLDSAIVLVGGEVVDWSGVVDGDQIVLFTVNAQNQIDRHAFTLGGSRLAGPTRVADRGVAVDDVFVVRAFALGGTSTFVAIQTFTPSRVQSRLLEVAPDGAVVASSDTESVELVVTHMARRDAGGFTVVRTVKVDEIYRLQTLDVAADLGPLDTESPIFDIPNYSPFDPEWGLRVEEPAAMLVPRLTGGDAVLELVTFADTGVERAWLDQAFAPLGTATGVDADGHTLLAWTDTVTDAADTTQQIAIAAVVPAPPDPDPDPEPTPEPEPDPTATPVLTTELRGTLRGAYAYPVDFVRAGERVWIVVGAYAGETMNTRLAAYPLSAEGRPACE